MARFPSGFRKLTTIYFVAIKLDFVKSPISTEKLIDDPVMEKNRM